MPFYINNYSPWSYTDTSFSTSTSTTSSYIWGGKPVSATPLKQDNKQEKDLLSEFNFFQKKMLCIRAQIKKRNCSYIYTTVNVANVRGKYVISSDRMHPFAMILDGRSYLPKISKIAHCASILNIDKKFLIAFHSGFSGEGTTGHSDMEKKYYIFGQDFYRMGI